MPPSVLLRPFLIFCSVTTISILPSLFNQDELHSYTVDAFAFPSKQLLLARRPPSVVVLGASRKPSVDVDDLVASIGLTPAKIGRTGENQNTRKSSKRKKKFNVKKTVAKEKQQTQSSSPRRSNEGSSEDHQKTKKQLLRETQDISLQTQLDYSREGHASIRNLIPGDIIKEIYHDLKQYSRDEHYKQKGEDGLPFLQYFNTWRDIPSIQRLTTSPLLCQAASTLLNLPISKSSTDGVKLRLYQDSVFIKRNRDGITPWHIDGRMMPFDTSLAITFWIPLHPIPSIENGGTALLFINKSHSDFSLPYWNGRGTEFGDDSGGRGGYNAYDHLATRYGIDNVDDDKITDNNKGVIDHHMPLNIGDVTVHNGWTMHCANGNRNSGYASTRYALSITYVDSHAEVREDIPGVGKNMKRRMRGKKDGSKSTTRALGDSEDSASYAEWIGDVLPRTRFRHELVPDVWPISSYDKQR
ncbi:hypothetical protein ACHAXR_013531 [Thalassiosira sp. AJA248-18]